MKTVIRVTLAVLAAMAFVAPAIAAPPCYPFGVRGESQFKADWFQRTSNGWYVFWVCKGADAKWSGYGLYCRHGICNQGDWANSQIAAGSAIDKAASLDTLYAQLVTGADCSVEVASNTANAPICRELMLATRQVVDSLNPAPPPPPPPPPSGYVVAPTSICAPEDKANGVCVKRQSFAWDGANRSQVAQPERAVIGAPCATSVGVAPYFGYADATSGVVRADRVVACKK